MEIITNKFSKKLIKTLCHENRTRIIIARQTEEKRRKDSRFNQKTRWEGNKERNEENSLLLCDAWIFASANRPSKSILAKSHNSLFAIYILTALCLCNFYRHSLFFGDGDKKRRYCNLLLLFVLTKLSGAWCMPHVSPFVQELTYLSKNDFNTLVAVKHVQWFRQMFSATHFI